MPVASFVESFKHSPTQQADMSWVWNYSVTCREESTPQELHGKYVDSGVRWEMHVSKQGEYSGFVWYYGESNLPATRGFWMMKDKPSDPKDLLRIDWRRTPHRTPAKSSTLTSFQEVRTTWDTSRIRLLSKSYDRSYTIYNKGKNQTTYVEWSDETKEGGVKDATHFRDEGWRYWDSALTNVTSP